MKVALLRQSFKVVILVTDWVPEIGFSGTCNQPKNGFKASRTGLFCIFCQILKESLP